MLPVKGTTNRLDIFQNKLHQTRCIKRDASAGDKEEHTRSGGSQPWGSVGSGLAGSSGKSGGVRVVVTTDKLEVRPDKHVDCPPVPDR